MKSRRARRDRDIYVYSEKEKECVHNLMRKYLVRSRKEWGKTFVCIFVERVKCRKEMPQNPIE
jgi:hypothetical protein